MPVTACHSLLSALHRPSSALPLCFLFSVTVSAPPGQKPLKVIAEMAMFEAVYLADTNNNLVYEYVINLSSPGFKSLMSIITQKSTEDNDIIEVNDAYSVYKLTTLSIIIYTLNVANINPLLPYNFITRLLDVIHNYFGDPLAIPKIEANNDTLTLLINQMIDDGLPNITDPNKLKEIVPFKSFLSKILSKTSQITTNATTNTNSASSSSLAELNQQSSIPWRRANVKYTNNEMYVDLIETVSVILRSSTKNNTGLKAFDSAFYSTSNASIPLYHKNLVPVTGSIEGAVNFTCHLTGVPYLQMILNAQGLNITPRFHKCINLDHWNSNKGNLSFIPPDGKFRLMDYSLDLNLYSKKEQLSMLGCVKVEYNHGLGANKNEFEIKLYIPIKKGVTKVENLTVEVNTGIANVITIKSNRLTHGDFSYKSNGKAEWNLRSIATGVNPILYGTIITDDLNYDLETFESKERSTEPSPADKRPITPSHLKLSYNNKGSLASGLKVDSLKIVSAKGMSDTVKPYKGVKYVTTTGEFVVRS